jgi:hypothetical protein
MKQHPAWKELNDYFGGPIPPVDHAKALSATTSLNESNRRLWNGGAVEAKAEDVIRALRRARVKFVLIGAHAANGWRRVARTTRDVDVLVRKNHHRKAVAAIRAAFPMLTPYDNPVVTRFRDPTDGEVAIDVMKPADKLHKEVFKQSVLVRQSHLVPNLEMMLACKFAAMVSPHREKMRKRQDAVDFGIIVQHNKGDINRIRLERLGALSYAGGGKEILKLVDDILADRPIVL